MKKEEILKRKASFSGKYEEKNFIAKRLLDNFYKNIGGIVADLEINKILEVGCGLGYSTEYLSVLFCNKIFEASDYNIELIQDARIKNPGIKFSEESIYSLKRSDASFDLVIALEVLEHLEYPKTALQELRRVTAKYCLLSAPREPIWRILNMARSSYLYNLGNTPGHINHWSKKAFINFIGQYFEIKKVLTPLPWIIVLAKK